MKQVQVKKNKQKTIVEDGNLVISQQLPPKNVETPSFFPGQGYQLKENGNENTSFPDLPLHAQKIQIKEILTAQELMIKELADKLQEFHAKLITKNISPNLNWKEYIENPTTVLKQAEEDKIYCLKLCQEFSEILETEKLTTFVNNYQKTTELNAHLKLLPAPIWEELKKIFLRIVSSNSISSIPYSDDYINANYGQLFESSELEQKSICALLECMANISIKLKEFLEDNDSNNKIQEYTNQLISFLQEYLNKTQVESQDNTKIEKNTHTTEQISTTCITNLAIQIVKNEFANKLPDADLNSLLLANTFFKKAWQENEIPKRKISFLKTFRNFAIKLGLNLEDPTLALLIKKELKNRAFRTTKYSSETTTMLFTEKLLVDSIWKDNLALFKNEISKISLTDLRMCIFNTQISLLSFLAMTDKEDFKEVIREKIKNDENITDLTLTAFVNFMPKEKIIEKLDEAKKKNSHLTDEMKHIFSAAFNARDYTLIKMLHDYLKSKNMSLQPEIYIPTFYDYEFFIFLYALEANCALDENLTPTISINDIENIFKKAVTIINAINIYNRPFNFAPSQTIPTQFILNLLKHYVNLKSSSNATYILELDLKNIFSNMSRFLSHKPFVQFQNTETEDPKMKTLAELQQLISYIAINKDKFNFINADVSYKEIYKNLHHSSNLKYYYSLTAMLTSLIDKEEIDKLFHKKNIDNFEASLISNVFSNIFEHPIHKFRLFKANNKLYHIAQSILISLLQIKDKELIISDYCEQLISNKHKDYKIKIKIKNLPLVQHWQHIKTEHLEEFMMGVIELIFSEQIKSSKSNEEIVKKVILSIFDDEFKKLKDGLNQKTFSTRPQFIALTVLKNATIAEFENQDSAKIILENISALFSKFNYQFSENSCKKKLLLETFIAHMTVNNNQNTETVTITNHNSK